MRTASSKHSPSSLPQINRGADRVNAKCERGGRVLAESNDHPPGRLSRRKRRERMHDGIRVRFISATEDPLSGRAGDLQSALLIRKQVERHQAG